MTSDDWRDLLGTRSREILAVEAYRREFSPEVVDAGWLGHPGVTVAAIAAAEARLGIALPPPYRAVLAVTNGWRTTKTFIGRVRPAGEVARYRDADPERLAGWLDGDRSSREAYNIPAGTRTTADGLRAALAVSDYGNAISPLVPHGVAAAGEWPAWFFAPWVPGENEYPSFWELMVVQHETFLDLERHRPQWEAERRAREREQR